MSISFDSTVSLNSNLICDAVINPTLNTAMVLLNFGLLHIYSMSGAHAEQAGSPISLTHNNAGGITRLNAASAVVGYNAGGGIDIIECATNYFKPYSTPNT